VKSRLNTLAAVVVLLCGCATSVTTTAHDLPDAGGEGITLGCLARWRVSERAVRLATAGNAVLHGVAMRDGVPNLYWVEGPAVVRRPSLSALSRYLGGGRLDRLDRHPFEGGLDQRFNSGQVAASSTGVLVSMDQTASGSNCSFAEWTQEAARFTTYSLPSHCFALARTDASRRALLVANTVGNRARFESYRWTTVPTDSDCVAGREFPQEEGPGTVFASAFGADETLYLTWSSTFTGRVRIVATNAAVLDPVEVHPVAAASVAMAARAQAWVVVAPEVGPIALARVTPTLTVERSATTLGASVDGARGVAAAVVGGDLLVVYSERGLSPSQRVAVLDANSGLLRATLVVETDSGARLPVLVADGDSRAILVHTTADNLLALTTLTRCDG
jgi:hypothetical protein